GSPVGVGELRPSRRILSQPSAKASDHQVHAKGEAEFFASKPFGDSGGDGHNKRFGAYSEDQAAGGHDRQLAFQHGHDRPNKAQASENENRFASANAVDDVPADEDHEDIRNAV